MKCLILNSGTGKRMGDLTKNQPKCFVELYDGTKIIDRQIKILKELGIKNFVITTGYHHKMIEDHCLELYPDLNFEFVYNSRYEDTNYIYSIELAKECLDDEILLIHGDLVFEKYIIMQLLSSSYSSVAASTTRPLPEKDFKIKIDGKKVISISINNHENSISSQPIYYIKKEDWKIWLNEIGKYCLNGNLNCYAEEAFNEISDRINMKYIDFKNLICGEIDNIDDLNKMNFEIQRSKNRVCYISFSTDIVHGGHLNIISCAEAIGSLVIGILSDEAVASYKHYPILLCDEKIKIFKKIKGVDKVIIQKSISYKDVLRSLKPDYVLHGDDWCKGIQENIRLEVINELNLYGGTLIEPFYTKNVDFELLEKEIYDRQSMPDLRRRSLKKLISSKPIVSIMEAHNGLTGLIVEKTVVEQNYGLKQFDGIWVSSLCDSTIKGKPDIELVDMTSRLRTIDEIMDVTTKPIIFDGDTGGVSEHFVFNVKTLERMGVSAIIIEDKTGLKKNSLFGTEVEQVQDNVESFCQKISAGKKVLRTKDFMIIARIESLILDKGMDDALYRAESYVKAGADGIMIHSRKNTSDEVLEFVDKFRKNDQLTIIVVVPTSYNSITEEELALHKINVVIYANHLIRSAFPAMQEVAKSILINHRSKEADDLCMSIKEIITLIPDR